MKRMTRYVGEKARTLYEKGKEHSTDALFLTKISHMRYHASEYRDYMGTISDMFTIHHLKA